MKSRNGFVSNSSTSSFIVAVPEDKTKVHVSFEVDLERYGKVLRTLDDLNEFIIDKYSWESKTLEEVLSDEGHDEEYTKMKKIIEGGKIIIAGSFCDDSGDGLETCLCEMGLNGTIVDEGVEVIEGSGGY